jgi:hypothetical protein
MPGDRSEDSGIDDAREGPRMGPPECIMCAAPADHQRDLVLLSERTLDAVDLCATCLADLLDEDWIELRDADPDD